MTGGKLHSNADSRLDYHPRKVDVLQLKAQEGASKWTLSWDFFFGQNYKSFRLI